MKDSSVLFFSNNSFFFNFSFSFFLETGFLCSFAACPGTHLVDQAGLELLSAGIKGLCHHRPATLFLYFMYMVFCPSVCLCEGVTVPDSCELPCGYWKLKLGPLEEQRMLLAAVPSLQSCFDLSCLFRPFHPCGLSASVCTTFSRPL